MEAENGTCICGEKEGEGGGGRKVGVWKRMIKEVEEERMTGI